MFSSARDTILSPSPPPKRNYLCHLLLLLYWRPFDICGCRPFKNWIKKSSFWMAKCQMASFLSKSGQFNNRLDTFWPFKIWTSQEFRFVFTYFVHLHSNLFRLEPFGVDAKISFSCKRGSLQVRLCIFQRDERCSVVPHSDELDVVKARAFSRRFCSAPSSLHFILETNQVKTIIIFNFCYWF